MLRAVGTTQHEAWVEPYSRLRGLDSTSVKKKKISYGKSGTFIHFISKSDVERVGLLVQI
jgi:hypothetical protein